MALSRRSRPKHSMLVQQLLTLVQEIRDRGETCLPSERELGEQFGVSRVTVRNALAELEEQGQIYRVQGKGAFVSTEKFHQPLSSLTSFTQDMDSQGMVSGARILALETIPAAIVAADSADVDVVAGATFTSNGIINAVKNALDPVQFPYVEEVKEEIKEEQKPTKKVTKKK